MVELDIDPRQDRRLFITSYGDRVTANLCVIEYKVHYDGKQQYPDKSERYLRSAGRLILENAAEPASRLSRCGPRDSRVLGTDGSESSCYHACTQCSEKRRQVHNAYQYSVQCSDRKTKQYRYYHRKTRRPSLEHDQISAGK